MNKDDKKKHLILKFNTKYLSFQEKAAGPSPINVTSSLIGSQLDDDSDDDDDGIQVTIRNIKSGAPIFPPSRQNSRTSIPCKYRINCLPSYF